ncbi:MAG: hypothetical protein R3E66_05565 [bacterium]
MKIWWLIVMLVAACGDCDTADAPFSGDAGTTDAATDAQSAQDAASEVNDAAPDSATDAQTFDFGVDATSEDVSLDAMNDGSNDAEQDAAPDLPGYVCGDGVVEGPETCDDAVTADCLGTHDGGDGACLPGTSCSAGFQWNGAVCVTTNTTGLTEPCSNGSGYTVFRFHYDNGSTSARIDVWDATCSYSFAPSSICNVREVYPGFGDISRTSEGYPIVTSSHYIRARFSVTGLNFSQANLYVQARSYATSSSSSVRAWSPIYGEVVSGLVDNDFVYDWYEIPWTGMLDPSDSPSLTAIQLYAYQGSGSVAIKAVELCVQ